MTHNRLTTRIGAIAAAIFCTGAVAFVAAPAAEATGWARCPKGYFCLFTGFHGTGTVAAFRSGDHNLADNNGPRGMNDKSRSISNRTGNNWCLYQDKNNNHPLAWAERHHQQNLPQSARHRISSLEISYRLTCSA